MPRHGGERLLLSGGLKQQQIKSSALHKQCSSITYGGAIHQEAERHEGNRKEFGEGGHEKKTVCLCVIKNLLIVAKCQSYTHL